MNKIHNVVATVVELAIYRDFVAFVNYVAVRVTDFGDSRHNAGAVRVSESPFNVVICEGGCGDRIVLPASGQKRVEKFRRLRGRVFAAKSGVVVNK